MLFPVLHFLLTLIANSCTLFEISENNGTFPNPVFDFVQDFGMVVKIFGKPYEITCTSKTLFIP